MNSRLLLALLASAVSLAAQTTVFGTKANEPAAPAAPAAATTTAPATTAPTAKVAPKAAEDEVDNTVVITPFRSLTPPEAKSTRTFKLSKMNKPVSYTHLTLPTICSV